MLFNVVVGPIRCVCGFSQMSHENVRKARFWCLACEPTRLIAIYSVKNMDDETLLKLEILNEFFGLC